MNEDGKVSTKKARLVCKGYSWEKGIDYGENFSPIVRLEGVRTLLSYATHKGFKVYNMDAKYVFLNGTLEEEVYIEKPKVLLILAKEICFLSYTNHYMVSNILLENGMNNYTIIF